MLYHKGQNYAVQLDINQASNNNYICSVVGAFFLGVVIVVVVVVLVVAAKECNYSEDEVVIAQVHKCWKSIRLATINSALLCCC